MVALPSERLRRSWAKYHPCSLGPIWSDGSSRIWTWKTLTMHCTWPTCCRRTATCFPLTITRWPSKTMELFIGKILLFSSVLLHKFLRRFQTPYFWPSNCWEPENTDYAVYLCKRTMQNKTRLELADYEAENLARLQKMFSRKWEFIFMQVCTYRASH